MNAIFNPSDVNNPSSISVVNPSTPESKKPHDGGGFPKNLPQNLEIILDQYANPFSVRRDKGNPYVLPVNERALNSIIRDLGEDNGQSINKHKLADINESLEAFAERKSDIKHVWCRVAQITDGIEVDLGDKDQTRVRILPNEVEIIESGSDVLFFRPQHSQPMVTPAGKGDISVLKKYVNVDDTSFLLFKAWLTYTLAHPKAPSSNYLILSLLGGQGTGKSVLSKLIRTLIDPSSIGVQIMPSSSDDLAIAVQYSHVVCYDNLRRLSAAMSDALCTAATRGAVTGRKLYTNGGQHVKHMHGAIVLNGIHSFINQPDLAQRCLPLQLKPFKDDFRITEGDMQATLAVDLPIIQRGLFDLISKIFAKLPDAKVLHPERMLDFSKWLAAMELADNVPAGIYQAVYSHAIDEGQRDTLHDSALGSAMLEFGESLETPEWTGTPFALLTKLNFDSEAGSYRSADWPDNPISMSKRLHSLQASLATQGVDVSFGRGKVRTITVKRSKSFDLNK
jgi:hypothetical protein